MSGRRKKTSPRTIEVRDDDGAGDEIRTRYLHLGKVALCQMSYARRSRRKIRQVVPQARVELATRGFSVRCSTN